MAYVKQNFVDGNVLYASELNHIEDGIADAYVKPASGIPASDIASSAVTSAKIGNEQVTRVKLASDALYSPITNVSTQSYSITSSDVGKTVWASGNNNVINLDSNTFTSLPIGSEIGITTGGYSGTVTIASGINIRTRCGGSITTTSSGMTLSMESWSTIALKKMNATYLYIVGEAEVVS